MWPEEVGSTPNDAQQPNVSLEPATRRAGRCSGEQEERERSPCGVDQLRDAVAGEKTGTKSGVLTRSVAAAVRKLSQRVRRQVV
jgi:hypothetical protein